MKIEDLKVGMSIRHNSSRKSIYLVECIAPNLEWVVVSWFTYQNGSSGRALLTKAEVGHYSVEKPKYKMFWVLLRDGARVICASSVNESTTFERDRYWSTKIITKGEIEVEEGEGM